jgi:stage II sporulation protein AA (anti-sigma F factor antagonist)
MTMQQNVPIPEVTRVAVLRIEGNVVRHEEPRIEQLVAEFLENGVRAFVFDFDRVTFIDSAGIGLIIKLAAVIERHIGKLYLCNPKSNVRNVFSMLGIEERFRIFDHLGDALEIIGNPLLIDTVSVHYPT